MKAKPIEAIIDDQEEMYFILVPKSKYLEVLEVAAQNNQTVSQLLEQAFRSIIGR